MIRESDGGTMAGWYRLLVRPDIGVLFHRAHGGRRRNGIEGKRERAKVPGLSKAFQDVPELLQSICRPHDLPRILYTRSRRTLEFPGRVGVLPIRED